MTRITFHLGLGTATPELIKQAQLHLAGLFGGFTWNTGTGGWIGDSGLEIEPSATITCYAEGGLTAGFAAAYLRELFTQCEVWYTCDPVVVHKSIAPLHAKPIAA